MNRYVGIVLAAAVLISIGIFLYSQNNQSSTVPTQPAALTQTPSTESATTPISQNIVTYTDSGFSPTNLTVKIGDSVTFQNASSKMMWVASNPHPTHTGLPGFDELSGMEKGQSYTFIFNKAGSFGYHNHLSAQDMGIIVVQ